MGLLIAAALVVFGLAFLFAGAQREARRTRAFHAARLAGLLADVRTVWPAGEPALWSDVLLARLVAYRPGVYGRYSVRTLNAELRATGVRPRTIRRRVGGTGRRLALPGVRWCRVIEAAS